MGGNVVLEVLQVRGLWQLNVASCGDIFTKKIKLFGGHCERALRVELLQWL